MKEKNENVRGYLKKLKNSSFNRIFGTTNLRWFEYNKETQQFGYKESSKDTDFVQFLLLNDITDHHENLTIEEMQSCEWKFGFKVQSLKKNFILFAQSLGEREKWKKLFDVLLKKVVLPPPEKKEIKLPPPKKKNPPIDYEEIERQRKLKEEMKLKQEQELARVRALEQELIYMERERERNEVKKKGFYDDIAVTVKGYQNKIESNSINLKSSQVKIEKVIPSSKETAENSIFILNDDQVDDWNYYGLDGNLITEKNNKTMPKFMMKDLKQSKEIDYNEFKKNLILENLCNDHKAQEKYQKLYEEEQKRKEKEARKKKEDEEMEMITKLKIEEQLKSQEEERRRKEEEKEKEIKLKSLGKIDRIKVELDDKRNLVEKYVPNIDPLRGTKYSIYDNVSIDRTSKNNKKVVNLKVEGLDLTTRANPKYLANNSLNQHQPFNLVRNNIGIQRSIYKSSNVDINKNKNEPHELNRSSLQDLSNYEMEKSFLKDSFNDSVLKKKEEIEIKTSIQTSLKQIKNVALFDHFMDDIRDLDPNYKHTKLFVVKNNESREILEGQKMNPIENFGINQSNKVLIDEFPTNLRSNEKIVPKPLEGQNKKKISYSKSIIPKSTEFENSKPKEKSSSNSKLQKVKNLDKSQDLEKFKKEEIITVKKKKVENTPIVIISDDEEIVVKSDSNNLKPNKRKII